MKHTKVSNEELVCLYRAGCEVLGVTNVQVQNESEAVQRVCCEVPINDVKVILEV